MRISISLIACLLLVSPFSFSSTRYEVIFKEFWSASKSTIYPKKKAELYFTSKKYNELLIKAKKANTIYELAAHINNFLKTLKVSHTKFYTNKDQGFYFLKSLFHYRIPEKPKIFHIGAQSEKIEGQHIVRSVLDGYPADKSGLRRGDIITKVDGRPFEPVHSFNKTSKNQYIVEYERNRKKLKTEIRPVYESVHKSFLKAISRSIKIVKINKVRIGYVHLWTGTSKASSTFFTEAILSKLKDCNGIIVDLRDGYGGAWWDHLDPFYSNRDDFFTSTWIDREGKTTEIHPDPKNNENFYSGPLVVIINEGVRSGKEALAYQFKKTSRAKLVGTKTAGFFVGGKGLLLDKKDYLLYLSSIGLLLDGDIDLESNGVEPDIKVPYSMDASLDHDPQFETALSEILKSIINN